MGLLKRFTNRKYYTDPSSRIIPAITGDRLWGQDWVRDARYLQGLPGSALWAAMVGGTPTEGIKLRGIVTAASATTINIADVVGIAKLDVDVPDDSAAWAVPATKVTDFIYAMLTIASANGLSITGGTLNGVATNYVKVSPKETALQSRQRHFEIGSWDYAMVEDYTFTCNVTAPTLYEICIATLVGNGSVNPVITDVAVHGSQTQQADTIVKRDTAGRFRASDPSAAQDVATQAFVQKYLPPIGFHYTQFPNVAVITATAATDVINWTAHGLVNGQGVRFTTTAADLPDPLAINTTYYVINKTADNFQLSTVYNGSLLLINDAGTGTHTCWVQDSPADMWPYTTWVNVSSKWADEFFRAEGGGTVAAVWGAAQQASQNKTHNHTGTSDAENRDHTHMAYQVNADTTGPQYTSNNRHYLATSGASQTHTHTFTTGNGSADGSDLRPINRTVRIWKRTV